MVARVQLFFLVLSEKLHRLSNTIHTCVLLIRVPLAVIVAIENVEKHLRQMSHRTVTCFMLMLYMYTRRVRFETFSWNARKAWLAGICYVSCSGRGRRTTKTTLVHMQSGFILLYSLIRLDAKKILFQEIFQFVYIHLNIFFFKYCWINMGNKSPCLFHRKANDIHGVETMGLVCSTMWRHTVLVNYVNHSKG